MAMAEQKATELANQTIDLIFPGEQQPESDHGIQYEQAETGTDNDRHFRRAKGWFSYHLKVKKEAGRLMITIRKNDRNKVAILLNNEKLTSYYQRNRQGRFYHSLLSVAPKTKYR